MLDIMYEVAEVMFIVAFAMGGWGKSDFCLHGAEKRFRLARRRIKADTFVSLQVQTVLAR